MNKEIFKIWMLIQKLGNQFELLFNEQFNPNGVILEEKNLLGDGYCFYFVNLLKKLLPEGNILYTKYHHYIFEYQGNYYDYCGVLPMNETSILVTDIDWESKNKIIHDLKEITYKLIGCDL